MPTTINDSYKSIRAHLEILFDKIYAIWLREFKVFLRERSRLVASTFTPLLWLFVLGSGIGSNNINTIDANVDYQRFIFPGIVSMSVIFTSIFYGSYIIWDRKFDFLKSVMVAPVSRGIVFVGKTFGGMTNSLVQVSILLIVGGIIGINYTILSLVQTVVVVLLLSFSLTSLGLTLGSYMHSLEGFQMIVSFVVFPIFFLSGALFSLDNLPDWLSFLILIDPATYAVDALRNAMIGIGSTPFEVDISILIAFTAGLGALGVFSFGRMKAI
jgi:ABC-2 type transport system permease protein